MSELLEKKIATSFVLVFWTKTKKTNVISQDCFEKSYKNNGKELPLCEGTVRIAVIEGNRHEAKILRICPSKKYLDSLLVSKEGEILLHGTVPPSGAALAKRSRLVSDETEEQKAKRNVLRALNNKAEEQPPNVRSNSVPECNSGCKNCCSKVMPVFPKFPQGFITALVSLAEYFQHFHKSTAANILAAGKALASMSDKLDSWRWPAPQKVELKTGTGVWIHEFHLKNIVENAELSRKPSQQIQQSIVKGLLFHLLGQDTYLETPAEKLDRRLMSGVVGYTNDKYPSLAQPIERYYRCINLNRTYLLKKKLCAPEVSQARVIRRPNAEDVINAGEKTKKPRYSNELNSVTQQNAGSNIMQNFNSLDNNVVQTVESNNILENIKSSDKFIINLDSESIQDILTGSASNININKLITVRRAVPSAESTPSGSMHANYQQVVSSNKFALGDGNVLTSSTRFNVQQTAPSASTFTPSFAAGSVKNATAPVNFNSSNIQQGVTSALGNIGSVNNPRMPNTVSVVPMSSPTISTLTSGTVYGSLNSVRNHGIVNAVPVFPMSTQAGASLSSISRTVRLPVNVAGTRPQQAGNILVTGNTSLLKVRNPPGQSAAPPRFQQSTSASLSSPKAVPLVGNAANSRQLSFVPSPTTKLIHRMPLANQASAVVQKNLATSSTRQPTTITTMSQLGSFKFASFQAPQAESVRVKTEDDIVIEGALDL